MKFKNYFKNIPLGLCTLASFSLLSGHLLGLSQEEQNEQIVFPPSSGNGTPETTAGSGTRQNEQIVFPPPSGNGAPGRTAGSGGRGDCLAGSNLQGFVPQNNIGSTMQSQLPLYFYIPQGIQDPIVFTLVNTESQDIVYTQTIDSTSDSPTPAAEENPNAPKLLEINLNADAEDRPLERDVYYQWTLAVNCDPTNEAPKPSISGTIVWETFDEKLWQELQSLPLADRPLALSEEGLAYDAIDTLFQWKKMDINNPMLESVWNQLLPQMPENLVP